MSRMNPTNRRSPTSQTNPMSLSSKRFELYPCCRFARSNRTKQSFTLHRASAKGLQVTQWWRWFRAVEWSRRGYINVSRCAPTKPAGEFFIALICSIELKWRGKAKGRSVVLSSKSAKAGRPQSSGPVAKARPSSFCVRSSFSPRRKNVSKD